MVSEILPLNLVQGCPELRSGAQNDSRVSSYLFFTTSKIPFAKSIALLFIVFHIISYNTSSPQGKRLEGKNQSPLFTSKFCSATL